MRFPRFKTRRGRLDLLEARGLWSRFASYLLPHRGALLGALVAGVAVVLMQLAAPWPIKLIFDHILPSATEHTPHPWLASLWKTIGEDKFAAIGWICGAILVIALLDALFCYVRDILLAEAGQRMVGKIRSDLFAHLQKLPPSEYEKRHTGQLLARLSGDIIMLRQLLIGGLVSLFQNTLTVVATLAAMLWLNPELTLIGVCAVPVALLFSWRIGRRIRTATEKQREKEGEVASLAQDVLGAMALVQAFNREPIEQKRFARQNRSTTRASLTTTRLEAKLYRAVSLTSALAMCGILFFGVRHVLEGRMTAGDLLVFVAYVRAISKPVRDSAKLTGQAAKASACARRVAEVFDIVPAIVARPGAVELRVPRGEITFEDVHFAYPARRPAATVTDGVDGVVESGGSDGEQAPETRDAGTSRGDAWTLSGVHLTIRGGERVAIVGHTGAGKSTLIKLLLRFYDAQKGCIRIDGQDLRDVSPESLRRRIGWVHQDTILFGMSIEENIALGRDDADGSVIRAVAHAVRADEFIAKLPQGYRTIIGQNGASLSGGQRQRIALARALAREPRILLLDEPATGLDGVTRAVVEDSWMSSGNTATTIVICHRLHAMQRFDRVVFMRDGTIAGCAPHDELFATNSAYATLCQAGCEVPARTFRIAERAAC